MSRTAALIPLLLAATSFSAQERRADRPLVEVVSVKENRSGETAGEGVPGGPGRFGAVNMTLRLLINQAYGGIPTSRILDGPDWADTVRFDVVGIGDPTQSELVLLQAVLRDRFALRVRRESRQFDVYSLVLARANGNLGPRLRPNNECSTAEAAEKPASTPRVGLVCGGIQTSQGRIRARGVSLAMLGGNLGSGRPVFERTGLKGRFDVDLEWAPNPTDDGPSLFTAVQEQLGLKLEPAKAPLDVLIIEHAERPTAN
jgi:uncharacterized protein (TIGR03435 family)